MQAFLQRISKHPSLAPAHAFISLKIASVSSSVHLGYAVHLGHSMPCIS